MRALDWIDGEKIVRDMTADELAEIQGPSVSPAGGGGAAIAEATDNRVAVCYTLDVSGSVNALRLRINGTIAVGAEATAQVQVLNMGGA